MIEAVDIRKKFNNYPALKGVSFRIKPGKITALIGKNGAGKTTLMKILSCLYYPTSGNAFINSLSILDDPISIKKITGYLPEKSPLYDNLRAMDFLSFIADSRFKKKRDKKENIERTIQECGLEEIRNRFIETLSPGCRQRISLAAAILHRPEVLILDEPTGSLDPGQLIKIHELIKEIGKTKTVLLSTHILSEAENICDEAIIIDDGIIVAMGKIDDLIKKNNSVSQLSFTLKSPDGEKIHSDISCLNNISLNSITRIEGDYYRINIIIRDIENYEEYIFDWAVERGYKLLDISKRTNSLESIFLSLTKKGKR